MMNMKENDDYFSRGWQARHERKERKGKGENLAWILWFDWHLEWRLTMMMLIAMGGMLHGGWDSVQKGKERMEYKIKQSYNHHKGIR